jgi:hypothetical protein
VAAVRGKRCLLGLLRKGIKCLKFKSSCSAYQGIVSGE